MLAIVVAAVIWVSGEAFGAILAGGGTDVNSGPLLALLALTYWPVRRRGHRSAPVAAAAAGERRRIMIPSWILDIFAAIMLVVAAVSAARLVAARPWQRGRAVVTADIDLAHLLMAIAMAGMLVSGLHHAAERGVGGRLRRADHLVRLPGHPGLPGQRRPGAGGGHCAPHLVHGAAMLYMFAAFSAPMAHGSGGMSGMGGMGTLALPFLAFLFALTLIGYSIWDLDQLSGPGTSGHYSLTVARVAPTGPVLTGVGASGGPGTAAARTAQASPSVVTETIEFAAEVPPASAPADGTGVLAPWVATGCRIAMGITMAFMLVIMI